MSQRQKLTEEQIEAIVRRREKGQSCKAIGAIYGVSAGAVHYQCLKHGALSPRERLGPAPVEPTFYTFGRRIVRRFTQAEDAQLLALRTSGVTVAQICRELDRPPTSVRIRLLQLAAHEAELA